MPTKCERNCAPRANYKQHWNTPLRRHFDTLNDSVLRVVITLNSGRQNSRIRTCCAPFFRKETHHSPSSLLKMKWNSLALSLSRARHWTPAAQYFAVSDWKKMAANSRVKFGLSLFLQASHKSFRVRSSVFYTFMSLYYKGFYVVVGKSQKCPLYRVASRSIVLCGVLLQQRRAKEVKF